MKDFEFLFCLLLAERILKRTADNLIKTIHATSMSAVEGHRLSNLCVQVFKGMRSEECFGQFWDYVEKVQKNLEVNDPTIPR